MILITKTYKDLAMLLDQIIEYAAKLWGNLQYFIAGAVGATIVTRYHKDQLKNPTDYAVFILSGAFMAHYLTQLVVFIFSKFGWVFDTSHVGAIGFLLGAFGGLIFQEIVSYVKSGAWKEMSLRQYFVEMFKSWISKGKK